MRRLLELLLILLVCLAASWGLSVYTRSLPATISGVVIDWNTGRPAPYADVQMDQLNLSTVVARTDARGRFSFNPPNPPGPYFLFAGPPRYGTLLQTTFGQTIMMYRKAERIAGVVLPAIPATELSGHVYGEDGKPISGCEIIALTRDTRLAPWTDLQMKGWQASTPPDMAAADDPQKFLEIEWTNTDAKGMFTFHRLGADRYFVVARCHQPAMTKANHLVWVPMLYPDATSISSAREILLLPGDRRGEIDFHLQQKRAYDLKGRVVFSNHSTPKPWPQAIYSQDLRVVRSDRSLTSSGAAWELCQIDANAGTFRCDGLLPGDYTFYFEVGAGEGAARHIRTQAAKVTYRVPGAVRRPLTVQLQNLPNNGVQIHEAVAGPGGVLDFAKVCAVAPDAQPAIRVLASGHGYADSACYFMTFMHKTTIQLPNGSYRLNAFEAAFVQRDRSYLGHSSKFEAIMTQHGTFVDLNVGETLEPSLPVLTTKQLISIAITSLRTAR